MEDTYMNNKNMNKKENVTENTTS
ncbi:DUF4021 domain-containing protein, partial [Bacillus cereus]